jgi:hypothetical protein
MTTLFIEADEPLLVFPSVETAEQHLEAIDVREGVYTRAFGPAGEVYTIGAEGERVVIRPARLPADPDSLQMLLQRSLQAVGETPPPSADLPALVAAAEAFWEERDPFGDRFGTAVPLWGCLAVGVAAAGVAAFIWG